MYKLLFCCAFMDPQPEPIQIDIIELPQRPKIAYRPDSRQPFSEQDKKFFADLRKKYIESSGK